MCTEPDRRVSLGAVLTAAGLLAGTYVAWRVEAALAPFLLPLAAGAVVLAVVSVPVTRWLARRVCYPSGALAYKFRPAPRRRTARRVGALPAGSGQTALPAGTSLALEAPQPVVYVITDAKEKSHVR